MAELNAGQADATTPRATITGELATIAGRERRLLDALADGNGAAEAIRTRLRAELEWRDTLTAELGQLETEAVVDTAALVRAATERAGDLRGLLARNIAQARQVVRQLLEGRLVCQPYEDAENRGYAFNGDGHVSPARRLRACQRRWWPQGAAIAGPFPVRLPVRGTLTLKAAPRSGRDWEERA